MAHSRTASLSEFVHFLFRAQLVDEATLQLEKDHPELNGQTGMQLKTFRESATPVDEYHDRYDLYDPNAHLNFNLNFDVNNDEDHFLGSSSPRSSPHHQTRGSGPQQGLGQRHARKASSRFDTSRFSDRTSFVSSPTSTTPSSPTMASVSSGSSASGSGWRHYTYGVHAQSSSRRSTDSRTSSTSTSTS